MAIRRIRRLKSERLTKPNILSFIAYTLILFFGVTILVNINPNANESYRNKRDEKNTQVMQWIFLEENGLSHILFGETVTGEHAAPQTRDFLLPKSSIEQQESSPEVEKWSLWSDDLFASWEEDREHHAAPDENSDFFSWWKESWQDSSVIMSWNQILKTPKKAYGALWKTLEDRSVFINMIFEYLIRGDIVELPEGAVRYVVLLYGMDDKVKEKVFEAKSCITPRGYEIAHWGSVLAYEQRADAPYVCNLERRTCKNWKLSGSFTQASCDENLNGNIKKYSHITTNTEAAITTNEYIQPDKKAKFEDADFNLQGKRAPNEKPHLISWPLRNETSATPNDVPLEQTPRKNCISPWWETIKAGQFTKAYRFQNGFTDIPCRVQLRLCVDGELEWTYEYPTCQPWETSYEDFLNGYMNGDEPSPQRLIKMLSSDFTPEPEMWNNLAPEIIDKMLRILKE